MVDIWFLEWYSHEYIWKILCQNEKIILNYFLFVILLNGIACYVILMNFFASAYGRYYDPLLGYPVPARLAWFSLEFPPLIVIPATCIFSNWDSFKQNVVAFLCISFLLMHYFQRSCIYGLSIRGGKPTPFGLFILGFGFNVINSFIQTRYLLAYPTTESITSPQFLTGMMVAILGFAINVHSDSLLRNLRKPHESGYKIPRGGLFEYVSCANFFGEIVEWFGFALATANLASLTFAAFAFLNLYPRAYQHHGFYLKKFEDYPKNRKILIPFVL